MARKRIQNSNRPPPKRHFIREWRKHRVLTQAQLAERLDVSISTISQLETGKQGYTQATLEALAVALNTDAASLLMRNPNDPDGLWSLWDEIAPIDRPRAAEVLRAFRRAG